jgi:hypothetical protein
MNTNTITKLVLAVVGLLGLGFMGLNKVHEDVLPLLGTIVGFGAAVVILAIAASDSHRRKRLS